MEEAGAAAALPEEVLEAMDRAAAADVDAFANALRPEAFVQPSAELAGLARQAAKVLYDYGTTAQQQQQRAREAAAAVPAAAGPLPELYVDGFDPEQIWLQLEMAAGPALKRARRMLRKVGPEAQLLTPETEEAVDELLAGTGGSGSDDEGGEGSSGSEPGGHGEGEEEAGGLSDLDYDALLAAGRDGRGGASDVEEGSSGEEGAQPSGSGEEEEEEEGEGRGRGGGAARGRKRLRGEEARAAVEDEHFKLDELEAFLEQAEREEEEAAAAREAAGGADGEEGNSDGDFDDAAGLEGEGREEGEGGDSEAELEALLDNAARMAGSKRGGGGGGGKKKKKRAKLSGLGGSSDEEEEEEDGGEGAAAMYEDFFGPRKGAAPAPAGGAGGAAPRRAALAQPAARGVLAGSESESESEEGEDGDLPGFGADEDEGEEGEELEEQEDEERRAGPSSHEQRLARLGKKIRALEEEALGPKDWFLRGEVDAGSRPKNSALEIDLDFETTVRPPPAPTEESRRTLEELIKQRIAGARFDDVVRLAAPPPETKRTVVELDDKKSAQGLGELYEADYIKAVAGVSEDKDEEVRQAARAQFAALCAKLDALSHLHFRPKPVIEEVTVKVDVPAIMMEEAAPQFVSDAALRAPEEAYASEAKAGAPRAEGELEREDRRRRRAAKKRGAKKARAAKEGERAAAAAARAAAAGPGAPPPLPGRKSAAAEEAARKLLKKGTKGGVAGAGGAAAGGRGRSEFSRSAAVFAKLQAHADGSAAAAKAKALEAGVPRAAHLKL